ncbi:hypothetical protein CIG19_01275 [Enterobacterales bacterium CwR94]|nr:hypothetical protein CIG19_01275 [Enterobacterales bacterium CwR94]
MINMKLKKSNLAFLIFILVSGKVNAQPYNIIEYENNFISLNKNGKGEIDIKKGVGKQIACKINDWSKVFYNGGGRISLTTDKKAVLVYPGNYYMELNSMLSCDKNGLEMHKINYYKDNISSLVDVNFENRLALALIVVDAQAGTCQAILSKFDEDKNILSGKGFWKESLVGNQTEIDAFGLGDNFYVGKISANGNYVSPNDLDCSSDAFPGVWDIKEKKRVVFNDRHGPLSIDKKCKILMSGKKTLRELQGELIE